MRHGSLFSGIGGFDLAAEWMKWQNAFHCEWEDFPRKVLKYYWPEAISYGDIKQTDFTIHKGEIDILTGGFPCQPFSAAGKRKGTEDDRHLWPEMLRAIREIAPRYIVGENVYGLVNWDGGMVFDQVQADLEAEGYEVIPVILPAVSVNAPHRRDRIWFVAYSENKRREARQGKGTHKRGGEVEKQKQNIGADIRNRIKPNGVSQLTPNPQLDGLCNNAKQEVITNPRLQRQKIGQEQPMGVNELCEERPTTNPDSLQRPERGLYPEGSKEAEGHPGTRNARVYRRTGWQNFPTQPPVLSGNDGVSSRLDRITFPKWRNESIKAAGNAIVPQVAYQIFKAIQNNEGH